MPRPKPAPGRRRLLGKKILQQVSAYDIDCDSSVPVSLARKFVATNHINYPAVINVRRNVHVTHSFFLAEKGMFGATYVEFNWMLFPCLREFAQKIDPDSLYAELSQYRWNVEEEYKIEYAFI